MNDWDRVISLVSTKLSYIDFSLEQIEEKMSDIKELLKPYGYEDKFSKEDKTEDKRRSNLNFIFTDAK
ncbi:hypothetical protein ANASTE_01579 [Anaerofustis stercorihominis DSM 17244]|uniref:Uncharacterized protein n=1 Tax=Anaerofustis stercorihominis DSM 17244 TaxID=445971 RepID=B1CC79_9FIRM|nr:hypothetical protein [Anaerofustis stercorihominis]EDS71876.1 hypothetical protein ANASTE_01579 [Anaerofustis stercorihominis DSM 17244]